MKPSKFKYWNKCLEPPAPGRVTGLSADGETTTIASLHVWTDGRVCVSLWRMSLRERLSALVFGRAWVAVLSGATQPPIHVAVAKEYLKEIEG